MCVQGCVAESSLNHMHGIGYGPRQGCEEIFSSCSDYCNDVSALYCYPFITEFEQFAIVTGASQASRLHSRLEPNLPLFLPILLFGNAQNFYLFCLKLCQCLPILPEIMPASTYFARNYANIFTLF